MQASCSAHVRSRVLVSHSLVLAHFIGQACVVCCFISPAVHMRDIHQLVSTRLTVAGEASAHTCGRSSKVTETNALQSEPDLIVLSNENAGSDSAAIISRSPILLLVAPLRREWTTHTSTPDGPPSLAAVGACCSCSVLMRILCCSWYSCTSLALLSICSARDAAIELNWVTG